MSEERLAYMSTQYHPNYGEHKIGPEISHLDIIERMVKLEQKMDSYLEFDKKREETMNEQIHALTEATMQNTIEIRTIVRLGGALMLVFAIMEAVSNYGGLLT